MGATKKEDKSKNLYRNRDKSLNTEWFNKMVKKRRKKAKLDAQNRKKNQQVARRKR